MEIPVSPKLFTLVRLPNLILLALTQYFVRIFLIGPMQAWKSILLDPYFFFLSLATTMIAAGGYVINDYYDIKIDNVNKPERVVVGRFLKRRGAILIHSALNFVAVVLGFLLNWKIGSIIFIAAFFMWFYSNKLKRLPFIGNFIVAFFTGVSLYIIAFYYHQNEYLIFIFSLFAFLTSLIREIIKDMEDIKGDEAYGCRTLPIVWGMRKTKNLLYLLIILLFTLVVWAAIRFSLSQQVYFFLLILFPLSILSIKIFYADTSKDFRSLSRICKIVMLCGIISMIII